MIQLLETELTSVFVLKPRVFEDQRGSFVKTYNENLFEELGIPFKPREEFFSVSHKNVVRGMHFQLVGAAHDKLVYCPLGKVLDVVVDLRKWSKNYGKTMSRELSGSNREMLFIPVGFAHGFLALEDNTMMVYQTSTVHSPQHDAGFLWNSFGFDWPVQNPILSDRDKAFPALKDFQSPF
ncbi:dTDP-4-dehydrorhamnose 3,5-epimerase [Pedosphaera parvula]|nr:dTDP-4-dehydrorhamnose 3,5-epimerase [Pedosphaera parvula]